MDAARARLPVQPETSKQSESGKMQISNGKRMIIWQTYMPGFAGNILFDPAEPIYLPPSQSSVTRHWGGIASVWYRWGFLCPFDEQFFWQKKSAAMRNHIQEPVIDE
jgi:hypothetical protein